MPSDGEGYYLFTSHFTIYGGEYAFIDLRVNGETVYLILVDNQDTSLDPSNAGCSAVIILAEGRSVLPVKLTKFTSVILLPIHSDVSLLE